jgi:glycosyltransferase involved in cell wall biosynthesis
LKPLAIVATHPIQYQVPFFRYLNENGVPVKVFFLSDRGVATTFDPGFGIRFAWDVPLLEGFPYEFIPNLRSEGKPEGMFGLVNPSVVRRLDRTRFSAILVHGYRNLSMLMAIFGGRFRRLPLLYRSDSISLGAAPARSRRAMGRVLTRLVSGFLTTGSWNDEFYDQIGVPPAKRFLVPHAVDNDRFRAMAAATGQSDARERLGVKPNEVVVLYAGKFIPEKQVELLIDTFAEVDHPGAHLVLVGDGPLRSSLEERSRSLNSRVTFTGFMNQSEIGVAYSAADVLVLPSRNEAWGLVVNEVMNFGVPALVSDRVGCAPDLVIEGKTGAVFDHRHRESLTEKLRFLVSDRSRLHEMGGAASEHIKGWDFAAGVTGVRASLSAAGVDV